MEQLMADVRRAETLDEIFFALLRRLEERVGHDNMHRASIVCSVLAVIGILLIGRGVIRMVSGNSVRSQPRAGTSTNKAAAPQGGKSHASGSGGKRQDTEVNKPATQAPQAPLPASPAIVCSGRSRAPTVSECGALKGISLPGAVRSSPDGYLIIAASRDKRFVRVYPQHINLVADAKNFKDFATLGDIPDDAVITDVVFSDAGGAFVLVDGVDGKVYSYKYSVDPDTALATLPKVNLTYKGAFKTTAACLRERYETAVLTDDGAVLLLMHSKEGAIEAVDLSTGVHVGGARVKAGNTAVWSHASGMRVAAAGSYIHDCRLSQVALRAGHTSGAVNLNKLASVACPKRVSQLALTSDGSFLCIQLSGDEGTVQIWAMDVNFERGEEAILVATLADADFASATSMQATCYTPLSTTRQRRLLLTLVRGSDAVVYAFDRAQDALITKALAPRRVCEVQDAHDGEPIRWAGTACRGAALMTCSETDSRNIVRLWPFQKDA